MSIADKLLTVAQNQQKVYDAGKQAQWSDLWDVIQDKGNRTRYIYQFDSWNDAAFVPKYDMRLVGDNNRMFYNYTGPRGLVNMVNRGLVFDTSGVTVTTNMFANDMVELPVISLVGADEPRYVFSYATKLETIEKVVLRDDGSQVFNNIFLQCYALTNLFVEGTIGQNGFSVASSNKLTHDSLMSIISALADYSTSGSTYTVTLGTTNLAKLTDEEKAIATQKGWTLA